MRSPRTSASLAAVFVLPAIVACSDSGGDAADASVTTPGDAGAPMLDGDTSPADAADEADSTDGTPTPPVPYAVDAANVVRRSNIVLSKPNTAPQDYVPIGGSGLGAAVWAANGFTAQLNRADTLPDRKSLGQVVIPGLAKLTSAADFKGQVDLYDAMLEESGGGIRVTAFVRADAPELVIDVEGADPNAMQSAQIKLWAGRSPKTAAANGIAVIADSWIDNGGMGASNAPFGTLAAMTVGGRAVHASVIDPLTVQVDFQPNADGTYRIVFAGPSYRSGDPMGAATTALGADATAATTVIRGGHLARWHDYWSHVGLMKLTSTDGAADYLEALRTIYLYTAASEGGDTFPSSQAGVADLFNFLQDKQAWYPAGYWFWNTRMLVAANLSSGAQALNEPIYKLYQSSVANLQAWTKSKMGGRNGICIPETMRFNGNGYYNGGEDNASCDQTIAPSYNALTITSGAEIGLWIWQHYLTTLDKPFLATTYPLMRESSLFLLAYATTGTDGLLHTTANAHETQWNVKDPVTDIVAMGALFRATIAAANVLGLDAAMVVDLQTALGKLPPLPRTDAATHTQLLTAADDTAGQDVFAISYEPAAMRHNGENLDLEAVWPYGSIGDDAADLALAKRTFQHRTSVHAPDWSCDPLQAARLGLGDEVASALVEVTKNYQHFISGMALLGGGVNDGTSEPYVEQAGIVAAALNEALIQDYDGLLRIAPAWPTAWDADGTVFIQGNSKVDVEVRAGQVAWAVIEAGSSGSIDIRNPWPGHVAKVIDGSTGLTVLPPTSATRLAIGITTGHWYVLAPAAAVLPMPEVTVTGVPATAPKTLGQARIGL